MKYGRTILILINIEGCGSNQLWSILRLYSIICIEVKRGNDEKH